MNNHKGCFICNSDNTVVSMSVQSLVEKFDIRLCGDCLDKGEHFVTDNVTKKVEYRRNNQGSNTQVPNLNHKVVNNNDSTSEFFIDLTEKVKRDYDPVLFRDSELDRVVRILSRKSKNNPVLVGDAGVGKTAIAELLAHSINTGKIPKFENFRVLELNVSGMMSGTKYRGEFEKNFEKMMASVDESTILFIDEIHMIMNMGGNEDNDINLSNLLKPHLSKGNVQLLGATTLDEFREIEKDSAFNRRLQAVRVNEFSKEDSKVLIMRMKHVYEDYHNVTYSEDIVDLIIDISDEYIKDRNFPDKAIDILDEVASMVSLREDPENEISDIMKKREDEVERVRRYFSSFGGDVSNTLDAVTDEESLKEDLFAAVTEDDVLSIVEEMSQIPVSFLKSGRTNVIKTLEKNLLDEIIGQDEAIKVVSDSAKRSLVKIRRKNKPTVLFFSGPTGVGKTETAKVLSKTLFGSEDSMIRLDMSEYMDETSVNKLIGSPPGYVGHDDEGQLTESVRRKPFSIILLDEFEKAHSKVSRLFLQVFDDGRLTDSKGRTIDFSNTIIVMTSNLGSGATEAKSLGFGTSNFIEKERKITKVMSKHYAPEFINRIDEVVEFNSLEKDDLRVIAKMLLEEYKADAKELGVNLKLSKESVDYFVDKSYDEKMGARPLIRLITKELEGIILDHITRSRFKKNVILKLNEEELVLT